VDGSLERWTAKEMLAKCSLELAFERIQAQRKQRVNDVGVAGVEPASVFGNRPNFPLGALAAGIIAA
jgi:hypothetical protein